uniref:Uncharacterized protein n=1 Tax=Setaria viridis TaxID=4556 RepID=A0A4U6VUW5_SETVI|nr:hypothetical protein SEVIR_2G188750v2 [Setaria viridis]
MRQHRWNRRARRWCRASRPAQRQMGSGRARRWRRPLPAPLLPPPTGAAIYGEQGEGCVAADCSTPGSGPAPAKGAWHSALLLHVHLVKYATFCLLL